MLTYEGCTLYRGGVFVCNESSVMRRFFEHALAPAKGHCLVTGLGLGLAASMLAQKPEVKSVTVIEKHQDAIDWFLREKDIPPKTSIVHADAFESSGKYDFALHDIWSDINAVPAGDEKKLSKRFKAKHTVTVPTAYKDTKWRR